MTRITIQNDIVRRDIAGNIMDCHDGCLERWGDRFYLYGARYGDTDGLQTSNRIVAYSSSDLQAWTPHGEAIVNLPAGHHYRPYVKQCPASGKFVMWHNWYPRFWEGGYGVSVSDSPAGGFELVVPRANVARSKPGDLGLFVDDDGTGYVVYASISEGHTIRVEKLKNDFLASTQEMSEQIDISCESPSMFKRAGVYYVLTGNTCYFCLEGSDVRVYTADAPLGPYRFRCKINRVPQVRSINAQQTHIARVPTTSGEALLWMGDRWRSAADGIKGHDLQYWGPPLEFNADGTIEPLVYAPQHTLDFE